ncbi:hypothetical protein IA69_31335 [Massilia sp. JS1662]|nr:hypothetical protein IA69_31335 [Massilia sp. JS1662]
MLLRWAAIAIAVGLCARAMADDFDPFRTQAQISVSQLKDMVPAKPSEQICQFGALSVQLSLMEAIERALCRDPQTRQAWADVKLQAAQVGIAQAAYLPTLNASSSVSKSQYTETVRDLPTLSYVNHMTTRDTALNLSWTLFDFGLRRATLENARQLLAAANATQDAALQNVFASTAQAYYQVVSTQATLEARVEAEKAARENFLAADARYKAGAGALADKLQAQTHYAQATLDRVRADGDWKSARGALTIAIGVPTDAAIAVDSENHALPDTTFVQSIDILMREAKLQHPSLLAAEAQLRAAQANVAAAQAQGRPTVSMIGNLDRNDQLGQYPNDTFTRNKSIGIQLNVPLLNAADHAYRVSAARAQAESKAAALASVEQQVALDVWKSYQQLETETADVKASNEFFETATQSYKVAQGRYKAGIGTILELISAQSAVANATQQRVQAFSNWRLARLKLVLSLGQLGFWAIQ